MSRDPMEWLASINPIAPPGAPESAEDSDELLESILASPAANGSRRRKAVVIGIAVAAGVAAAAAAWIVTRSPSDPVSVACFAEARIGGDVLVVPRGSDGPVASCRAAWEAGGLPAPIPTLQACVLDDGSAGVFPGPGPQVCDELGLDRAGALGEEARRLLAVEETVAEAFSSRCVPLAEGAAVVDAALDAEGIEGWEVVTDGPLAGNPCASLSVEADREIIRVVPIPDLTAG